MLRRAQDGEDDLDDVVRLALLPVRRLLLARSEQDRQFEEGRHRGLSDGPRSSACEATQGRIRGVGGRLAHSESDFVKGEEDIIARACMPARSTGFASALASWELGALGARAPSTGGGKGSDARTVLGTAPNPAKRIWVRFGFRGFTECPPRATSDVGGDRSVHRPVTAEPTSGRLSWGGGLQSNPIPCEGFFCSFNVQTSTSVHVHSAFHFIHV